MTESRRSDISSEHLRTLSLGEIKQLRRRLETRKSRTVLPPLVPQERGLAAPLSYAQERLWFLDQLGLVGPAYNTMMALELDGHLNVAALEHSLFEIVRRHESLRTHFESIAGNPVQVVDPPREFLLSENDLSALEKTARSLEVKLLMRQEVERRFDLSTGPMLRALLLKLRSQQHILLVTMHHIVSDGWSRSVLHHELGALYAAFARDEPSPLPELPVQYVDYAIWQRTWLTGEILDNQLRYWKKQLKDVSFQLELPSDRPRPALESFKGAEFKFVLSTSISKALKDLGRREGATLFMLALAAFQLLLSRWSGQRDIVVGAPIAGRGNREVERLIGFLVNTLILRVDVSGHLTFRQLLGRVKEVTLEAYAHQEVPFDALVKELRPDRNLACQPIFQVMLAMENYPEQQLELPGITWTPIDVDRVTTHFDLTLYLLDGQAGLAGTFEYSTDLFDESTIARMAAHLRVLLTAVIEDPDKPIAQLRMIDEAEKRKLAEVWNATTANYPRGSLIHELFEEQVRRSPDAIAALWMGEDITYWELNRRANRLADYLRERGEFIGEFVPILMQRCLLMLVAQLAVLKSGAAYVPLDPALPRERQLLMIRDCRARWALTDQPVQSVMETKSVRWVNCTDAMATVEPLPKPSQPLHLGRPLAAYVMYTSGSTGVPKGVAVPHHAISRLIFNNGYAAIDPTDCIAHCSNPAFDASTFEVWAALLNGARVLIVPQSTVIDPSRLARVLKDHGVTVLWLTIGLLTQSLAAIGCVLGQLRYLLTGGDVVEPATAKRVLREIRPQRFINAYGPTECTTFSTTQLIDSVESAEVSIPIGRPIANTQIYILDRYMELAPIGVAGEIYIGGEGVALGYVNRPQLTSERFVANPFSLTSSGRLYKTGDVARWRADGTIEFLGRHDTQVKIRGFRIELGEIEEQLRKNPQVKAAVVIACDGGAEDKRIVAYVVAEPRNKHLREESERAGDEVIGQWKVLYEETYSGPQRGPSYIGWDSSYTGQPIPEVQMQEWLSCTVERIR
ncbi:amino acid adenylation domain-containing protein, partial [Steroidobacter flavus]